MSTPKTVEKTLFFKGWGLCQIFKYLKFIPLSGTRIYSIICGLEAKQRCRAPCLKCMKQIP
jgi:hypothetical protein